MCDCAYVHGSSINELTVHARAIEFACMHIGVLAMAGTWDDGCLWSTRLCLCLYAKLGAVDLLSALTTTVPHRWHHRTTAEPCAPPSPPACSHPCAR